MALELLGYIREIHGHLLTAVGRMQTQAEAQRAEARQREKTLREDNLAREQLRIQTNAEREKIIAENELKRQTLSVETNAALLKEKMRADLQKRYGI